MNMTLLIQGLPIATQVVHYRNDMQMFISRAYDPAISLLLAGALLLFGLLLFPRNSRWFRVVFTWLSALLVHLYLGNLTTFWRFSFGSPGPFANDAVVVARIAAQVSCWGLALYTTVSAIRARSELQALFASPLPLGLTILLALLAKNTAYNAFTARSMRWEDVFSTVASMLWAACILVVASAVCAAVVAKRISKGEQSPPAYPGGRADAPSGSAEA